ncbi:hypothetical protein [Pedobacter kyonggii]|uniref:hypothetical protein n=1 Tax=Pedobacter kyonggii TaxID=1926871 RepID=UPI0013EF182A|nr:hypothetical protein [Pedobacter kyonggii]
MGGGISIFNQECVSGNGKSICEHINEFYLSTVNTPIIYCIFDTEDIIKFLKEEKIDLPEKDIFEFSPSDKGDECHVDIKGIDNKLSKKLSKTLIKKENLHLCGSDFDLQNADEETISSFLADAKNALAQ